MDRPEPLYLRLAERIVKDIAAGRLKPGDRLPTEAQLGAGHKVSRITVRHALELVRRRGLIERGVGARHLRGAQFPRVGVDDQLDGGLRLADRRLARRLEVRPGDPLLILDVMLHGADGRRLEYAKAWYRADQFRRRNQVDRMR